ncbi:hypothetical protein R3X27_07615 [Tropicimonas sp. TH_r6]|uniref:MurR/RpiR family transcriptional regulator n=1 Tax=Tropicimonas sp. TH_r6 TaxID=3082085 RepID=UPI0029543B82|nr:hypothetical protein [Tropicimonas sp. TH_r6]MDV7142549.1 hypothetical protein [Tropicimonas sp. TH_r6]
MIRIDFDALNPLERKIHATLKAESEGVEAIPIAEAARLCSCSPSKISKFSKKLGFNSYRQYLDFLYDRVAPEVVQTSELARLAHFIEGFDNSKVDALVELIGTHDKLMLLGYGPSFHCAEYFEYRLKTCTGKMVVAVADELLATSMTDENTLLLVLTVTGSFKPFDDVYHDTVEKGGEMALIVEEYNPDLIERYGKVFCLTDQVQCSELQPFEKNRTVLFIFLEEVVRKLMRPPR